MIPAKRLLIADDDPRDVELALLALGAAGLGARVDVVRDGEGVLDYLRARGREALPAAILLDLKMPGMHGAEVVRAIRADNACRAVPVVIFTSSRHERDVEACQAAGANAYVVKPVDFQDFTEAVANLGAFWLGRNVTAPFRPIH
ncbi:MAG TPA: response regulator [Holophaga sp.]|nr:response regulator [Holophaga sp.]